MPEQRTGKDVEVPHEPVGVANDNLFNVEDALVDVHQVVEGVVPGNCKAVILAGQNKWMAVEKTTGRRRTLSAARSGVASPSCR